jgi:O-antigen ligase
LQKLVLIPLWCLVFIVPWEGMFVIQELGGETLATAARLLGAATFATAVVAVTATASMRRLHLGFIPLAAFVLWNWASLAWTIAPDESMDRCVTLSLLLVLVWLIWEFAPSLKAQRSLMWAFILGNALTFTAEFVEFFRGEAIEGRYIAAASDANFTAVSFVLAIGFMLYLMNTLNRGLRIAAWGYILVAGLGVLLTSSRAGLAGLAICILVNLVNFRRIGWGQAFAILSCLALGWLLLPQSVVELLTSRVEQEERTRAVEIRQELWAAGLKAWETNPLLGVGAGSYRIASEREGGRRMVAHNTFINVLVENGIVGFGILLFMCVMFLRLVWHMPPGERGLWIALLAAFSVQWNVTSQEYQKVTWLMYALILAQSAATAREPPAASPRGVAGPSRRVAGKRNGG